jgi:hypothetical protein
LKGRAIRKPGTAINLLKERTKVKREHSAIKFHNLRKRFSTQVFSKEEEKQNTSIPDKRYNLGASH